MSVAAISFTHVYRGVDFFRPKTTPFVCAVLCLPLFHGGGVNDAPALEVFSFFL